MIYDTDSDDEHHHDSGYAEPRRDREKTPHPSGPRGARSSTEMTDHKNIQDTIDGLKASLDQQQRQHHVQYRHLEFFHEERAATDQNRIEETTQR